MDKLTHTGLHGADTTRATLEKLFGIDINYTLRVNFSSVENIVDALGGITVDNTDGYAFSIGGYDFHTERDGTERGSGACCSPESVIHLRKETVNADAIRCVSSSGMIDKATSPASPYKLYELPGCRRRFFRDRHEHQ